MEDQQKAPGLGVPGHRRAALSFRLLAVDIDGTLVDAKGTVHGEDREAIAALAVRGIPTTIVTGRLFSGTRTIAAEVGATGAVACVDGCHLVEAASGREFHHGSLAGVYAAQVRELLVRRGVATFAFARDRILYDDRGAPYIPYVRTWSLDQVWTERVTNHPHWEDERGVTALVCVGVEHEIKTLENELQSTLGSLVYAVAFPVRRLESESGWGMVIRAAGYSKGTALVWLAQHYGVLPEEVVAVGDWYNDVPMFEAAGRSFAMRQAPHVVKEAATDQLDADSQTGGGIAEAARKAGLL